MTPDGTDPTANAPDRCRGLPPADLGLGSWPARRARISPDAVALSQSARSLTYRLLAARVDAVAGALARRGVQPGDRVAYLGLNDVATFETLFAAGRLGAVFVPINHRLAAAEIEYLLADAEPHVLVVGPGVAELAGRVLNGSPAHRPARVLRAAGAVVDAQDAEDLDEAAAAVSGAPFEAPGPVRLDDPALFLYTSGTTGRPKGAVLSHGNLTWNTVNQLAHLDVLSTDRALCIAPLFHAVGLGQVTLPVLFKGGAVEVVPKFDAGQVLAMVEALEVASFSCVPTMLQLMAEHPAWPTARLESLRHVVYGGSPVAEHTARAWLDRGVQLQQGYGMTEAGPGVAMVPATGAGDRPVSAGVPHFFTDVAVLGQDGSAAAPGAGRRGELLVRGPHVFQGYWRQPSDSAEAMVGPDHDWYRTGDVLEADAEGWLTVVDRVKDLIISGGENIYPAEVEAVLAELPAVRSAAVVGAPDERWGEVGIAYVETRPGEVLDRRQALEHLRGRLAGFKLPRELVVVDQLPRNATGKILRASLREDASRLPTDPEDR